MHVGEAETQSDPSTPSLWSVSALAVLDLSQFAAYLRSRAGDSRQKSDSLINSFWPPPDEPGESSRRYFGADLQSISDHQQRS